MKMSQLFTKTTKDTPSDEVSLNAQLLHKAGFIDKGMAGVYAMLPLGLRVLNKVENIVRKHLKKVGSQEVLMNTLHSQASWEATNRWEGVDILFKLKSKTGNNYAVAASHEEQATPIAKRFISSWKDLPEATKDNSVVPLSFYQIQTKFRDELRAKSGLLRGREFRMKDAYDFHTTNKSLDNYYDRMKSAYFDIYNEMGLSVYAVQASGGIFTEEISHEFQAVCDAGEDFVFLVPGTDLAYNQEIAPSKVSVANMQDTNLLELKKVKAEGVVGVKDLCKLLDIPAEKTTKTLFYTTDKDDFIAVVVRGDYDVNEEKVLLALGLQSLSLASEEIVMQKTGAKIGYAGVINLPGDIDLYFDDSCKGMTNFESGSNETGYHHTNINFGRDVAEPETFYDLKDAKKSDIHPETGKKYEVKKVAEVGNIFKLGDKYSKAFDLTYADKDNKQQYPVMGCHGIGTSRCMAVIAEVNNDENGLKWPKAVAPFQYHLITYTNPKDDSTEILDTANKIYDKFEDDVLWDDRAGARMGEKFKDADLIGCPTQIVLTKRSLENGGVEVKDRATGETKVMSVDELLK